jgi:hypothetical protein
MQQHTFGTAINCIDGRVQEPVARWLKDRYGVDFVDTVTAPGCDKLVSDEGTRLEEVIEDVLVSVRAHGSRIVALAGHHDCAGNPVGRDKHIEQIKQDVAVIRSREGMPADVVGLWVNEHWEVELVAGTHDAVGQAHESSSEEKPA